MSDDDKPEWVRNPETIRKALAEIDRKQAHYPQCVVCGQRAVKLDKAGTCSKTSAPHVQHRAEYQAGVRA